jgi:hypothetical protein
MKTRCTTHQPAFNTKPNRFTLQIPACVTVNAIGMIEPRSLAE